MIVDCFPCLIRIDDWTNDQLTNVNWIYDLGNGHRGNLPKYVRICNGSLTREQGQFDGRTGSFRIRSFAQLEIGENLLGFLIFTLWFELLSVSLFVSKLNVSSFKVVDNVANPKTTRRSKSRHESSSNSAQVHAHFYWLYFNLIVIISYYRCPWLSWTGRSGG